jgi:hypothetical protein
MKRICLLVPILMLGLGVTCGRGEDARATTMKEYTDHLLQKYGPNGKMITGEINAYSDYSHQVEPDIFPPALTDHMFDDEPIKLLSQQVTDANAQCDPSQVIVKPNSGAYAFPWCAKYISPYEAQRDTLWYAAGRWTYVTSYRYDCANTGDVAQMPTAVQLAVCH